MNNNRNELIPLHKDRLSRYKQLYLRKEKLIQECNQLEGLYLRLFGESVVKCIETQVKCISLKKEIALYQAAYNRGENPDPETISVQLNHLMKEFQDFLENYKFQSEMAQNAKIITEEERLKIRRIHRDLVFKMHPDLHPEYADDEEMMNLWQTMTTAYECMDLKTLEQVALQVAAKLERNETDGIADLDEIDIDEKISELEEEIQKIVSTDPYLYRNWIYDQKMVQEKTDELNEQIQELQEYAKFLEEELAKLVERCGGRVCPN